VLQTYWFFNRYEIQGKRVIDSLLGHPLAPAQFRFARDFPRGALRAGIDLSVPPH
jgi:hypothetical protein